MKKIISIVMLILFVGSVSALDWCKSEVSPGTACEENAGLLGSCGAYTVDIYNASHSLIENDLAMTQIGSTGVYYFTFILSHQVDRLLLYHFIS